MSKFSLLIALLICAGTVSAEPGDPGPEEKQPRGVREILSMYSSSPEAMTSITLDPTLDGICGYSGGLFDVVLHFPGVFEGEAYDLRFMLRTLTADQMINIYMYTKLNYAQKGLPQCSLKDQLKVTNFDRKEHWILFQPADQPRSDIVCGYYKGTPILAEMPMSACSEPGPLYP